MQIFELLIYTYISESILYSNNLIFFDIDITFLSNVFESFLDKEIQYSFKSGNWIDREIDSLWFFYWLIWIIFIW